MADRKAATALIVEDDQRIRELLAYALSNEGYSALRAQDGWRAIQLLDELILPSNVPCVILLDMMLPRVSGLGVLEHLREQGAKLPVVAMSASPMHLAAAQAAGTNATLAKPFDLDDLLKVVAEHCPLAS